MTGPGGECVDWQYLEEGERTREYSEGVYCFRLDLRVELMTSVHNEGITNLEEK